MNKKILNILLLSLFFSSFSDVWAVGPLRSGKEYGAERSRKTTDDVWAVGPLRSGKEYDADRSLITKPIDKVRPRINLKKALIEASKKSRALVPSGQKIFLAATAFGMGSAMAMLQCDASDPIVTKAVVAMLNAGAFAGAMEAMNYLKNLQATLPTNQFYAFLEKIGEKALGYAREQRMTRPQIQEEDYESGEDDFNEKVKTEQREIYEKLYEK